MQVPEPVVQINKSKVRRRTAHPSEMLYGHQMPDMTHQHDSHHIFSLDYNLQGVPSLSGSLKLVNLN